MQTTWSGAADCHILQNQSPLIDVLCEPSAQTPLTSANQFARKSGVRRKRLLKEFDERSGDYNTGGSTRRQLVTAYREKALRVASALRTNGEASPANLARQTGVGSAAAILQKNYYGWFERLSRGKYILTIKGVQALTEHAHMLEDNDMIERTINELDVTYSVSGENNDDLAHIAEAAEFYLKNTGKI